MSFTIDIHHHILPDFFWRATNEQHGPVGGIAPARWSAEGAISFMDEAGIDIAVSSISTPGVHMGDDDAARVLARQCNEFSVLDMLRSVVGLSQVLYGSDFPYLPRELAVKSRSEIEKTGTLNEAERTAVLGANALSLLPRLAKSRGIPPS